MPKPKQKIFWTEKVFIALIGAAAAVIVAIIGIVRFNQPNTPSTIGSGANSTVIQNSSGVSINNSQPGDLPCIDSNLNLSMEIDGDLIPGQRGGTGDDFASGRLYQFTLTNTSTSCRVIVKDIQLAVLATVIDNHNMLEANTAENQYEVIVSSADVNKLLHLTPIRGAPRAEWNYHFLPSSPPDRFRVEVIPSEWGHSFAIQFVVSWYDPLTKKNFSTKSPIHAAFFPKSNPNDLLPDSQTTIRFREKQCKTWRVMLGNSVKC